ncbi:YolD-like family protein [Planococcus liqunii]|uniref:YolD-like family protein n=1 Tax=Planococcus liqunii TaxID=3058394 RepID=A0ABT8MRR0_9BACL|nr:MULTISPECIES: YolD-like family protein [unclassified Planococcus (in: firmicutes)]MDN7227595.1 YolD-like family protein [Planococcus sp. N064]WKA50478.1 YolD-like family protein [Planococcus sp. N056]
MKLNKHLSVKGQIKDRGRIKWTAMMLTEHVDMLKKWQEEDRYNSRPVLDEFDLEAIFEEIQLAYKRQCDVEIQIWRDGSEKFTGLITTVDLHLQKLHLDTGLHTQKLSFGEIIGAKTLE